jgi:hypothetical protein
VGFRFWYIEAVLVVLFFVGIFGIPSNPPPENPDFVPNAVNGLVTMSGIMTALTGYLITYIIPRLQTTPKLWISKRIIVVLCSIALGLCFVVSGLSDLVFGSMEGSYEWALFGTFLLMLAFFEVMFMVIVAELEQTTNLSDTF